MLRAALTTSGAETREEADTLVITILRMLKAAVNR